MGTVDANSKAEAVELSYLAGGYLDGAERLCCSLIDSSDETDEYNNRVVLHLVYLGIELVCKAALVAFTGRYPKHHDIRELLQSLAVVAPHLPLQVPSFVDMLTSASQDFLDGQGPHVALHFERYRYYADRKGRPFPELQIVDLAKLRDELHLLRKSSLLLTLDIWKSCGVLRER